MNAPAPFDLQYPPQFAELLSNLGVSLVLSTYQAGKAVLLSPVNSDHMVQLPRTFPSAMGMAVRENTLAIATKHTVELLEASEKPAASYPQHPGVYDWIYFPRATFHTGSLMLHDMAFIGTDLVAVNTMFSTLSKIGVQENFTPLWKPPFISDLMPEDRCHLNGMAVENDQIKYLTALGSANTFQGWRENKMNGGILMEYPSGKIILDGLAMPHSPRIYDGKLYVLNSAQGELIEVNTQTGSCEVIVNLGGFARGMDRIGDYLFIGISKLRHNNEIFANLPIAGTSFAGVLAVHLPTRTIIAKAEYKMSVEEIYDVKILPGKLRPNILSTDMEIHKQGIVAENIAFWINPDNKNADPATKVVTPANEVKESKNVQFQILKKASPKDVKELFGNMISKSLNDALMANKTGKSLNLIVASENANPAALVVFEAKTDKTALIWSVFVKPEMRRKGLARLVLKNLHNILLQNDINDVAVACSPDIADEPSFEKLFGGFENIRFS